MTLNSRLGNLITCIYLVLVVYGLYFTRNLYRVDENVIYLYALMFGELIKYFVCYLCLTKSSRRAKRWEAKMDDTYSFGKHVFKTSVTTMAMILIFHVTAVLLGASVFSDIYKTFNFATLLSFLTVFPCCLHLGAESIFPIFTSLMDGHSLYAKPLFMVRLTIFGAWLGSCLIPLDWDRPYQIWPIPCCLGALGGNFLSNFLLLVYPGRFVKNEDKLTLV